MRKHCKRVKRKTSRMLSMQEHQKISTIALMHLELLLTGHTSDEYAFTVAAFLNIGAAVAHLKGNLEYLAKVNRASMIMHRIIRDQEIGAIKEEDATNIRQVMLSISGYLNLSSIDTIRAAIQFVERALATGEGAEVISMRWNPWGKDDDQHESLSSQSKAAA